ncbi:MAG: sigma 54-interacting transcriptional regulator [Myxococcota bacterium]
MQSVVVVADSFALAREVAGALERAGYAARARACTPSAWDELAGERVDVAVVDASAARRLLDRPADALLGAPPLVAMRAAGGELSIDALSALRAHTRVELLPTPFGVDELEAGVAAALRARPSASSPPESDVEERLRDAIEAAAATDATVLVRGENGSGTSTVARAIHRASRGAQAPFVEVDARTARGAAGCAQLRAAFEEASASARGRGALAIDRLGELDPPVQAALVALLDATPAGAGPRWFATTSRPLADEVRAGRLRPEIAYRFEIVVVDVPPLRARAASFERVARELLRDAARRIGVREPELGTEAVAALARHPFRGNLVELAALMERAALLFAGRPVDAAQLVEGGATPPPAFVASTLDLRALEEAAIRRSLAQEGGNRVRAAEVLGISVKTLRNKIQRYGLADVGRPIRPTSIPG